MRNQKPIATGTVGSLWVNGRQMPVLKFKFDGPVGDDHAGMTRELDGHDGDYVATSRLKKGHGIFNWRTWTAISIEEMYEVEHTLALKIPGGCLLENIIICGIPGFSQLPPTSRLVFPKKDDGSQVILAVWEENGPCDGVGKRLQNHYPEQDKLSTRFIAAARHKRGVMGFVISEGYVENDDVVEVYPPTK